MKKAIALVTLLLSVYILPSFSQTKAVQEELVWQTDIKKAQELSNSLNKPIFAFFTGSDWCGWCHRLQRNVFAKPEFKEWAKKNVVLLELDFPRNKQLAPELARQNAELQQTFQVQGFPTIWMFFLTKDTASNHLVISPLGSMGYPSGAEPGKEEVAFLAEANGYLKNAPKK